MDDDVFCKMYQMCYKNVCKHYWYAHHLIIAQDRLLHLFYAIYIHSCISMSNIYITFYLSISRICSLSLYKHSVRVEMFGFI